MIIMQYEIEKTPLDELEKIFCSLKEATEEEVIAIPSTIDIIRNCSLYQLNYIRELIEEAIEYKLDEWRR